MCVCVCVCVRERERDRQTDRQTETETDRQTETETETEAERDRERQRESVVSPTVMLIGPVCPATVAVNPLMSMRATAREEADDRTLSLGTKASADTMRLSRLKFKVTSYYATTTMPSLSPESICVLFYVSSQQGYVTNKIHILR